MERKPYSLAYSPFTRLTAPFWVIVAAIVLIATWFAYAAGLFKNFDWTFAILVAVLVYVINIRSDIEEMRPMLNNK